MKKKNEMNLFQAMKKILGNQFGEVAVDGNVGNTDPNPNAKSMGNSTTGEPARVDPNTNTNASGTQGNNSEDDKLDVSTLPQSAQDLIKSLRGESADHRTKNNNLNTRLEKMETGLKAMFGDDGDGQDLTPEQQISQLQSSVENSSYENAVQGMAYEAGIPHGNFEYFQFLMQKEVGGLEEGQELSEETLAEIVGKAKGFAGSNINDSNSTVTENDKGKQNPDQNGEVSLDAFVKMSVTQKSELYTKSPEVYNSLFKQAKEKRLL